MANVLIVEDDKLLSQAYYLILDREGHQVRVAANGAEALELVSESDPEIILLDLQMPIMDGLEFLEKYELQPKHPETTVVILSNVGDDKQVKKGLELGAYKYVVKAQATPIQLAVLVNSLISKNIKKKIPTAK